MTGNHSQDLSAHAMEAGRLEPVAGRITGFNHIMFIVQDMAKSLWFYRDVLGLTVIRTLGDDYVPVGTGKTPSWPIAHTYFFRLPDGSFLALSEVTGSPSPQQSARFPSPWPADHAPPASPQKCDHIAFEVGALEDLLWFRDHLRSHGVETSELRRECEPPRSGSRSNAPGLRSTTSR